MSSPVVSGPHATGSGPAPSLPARDIEFLQRLARGESLEAIATSWYMELSSVRTVGERLRKRLGANTNEHAVFLACQAGILDGRPQRHGDHAGFAAHRYRGEEPCEACWDGERAYRTDRRAARKAARSAAA